MRNLIAFPWWDDDSFDDVMTILHTDACASTNAHIQTFTFKAGYGTAMQVPSRGLACSLQLFRACDMHYSLESSPGSHDSDVCIGCDLQPVKRGTAVNSQIQHWPSSSLVHSLVHQCVPSSWIRNEEHAAMPDSHQNTWSLNFYSVTFSLPVNVRVKPSEGTSRR